MANNQAIEEAIADLHSQKILNIESTAKKYNFIEFILRRHYKNETISYNKNQSKKQYPTHQHLKKNLCKTC